MSDLVKVTLSPTVEDAGVILSGTTNLPNGTELMLSVASEKWAIAEPDDTIDRNDPEIYHAQDKAVVMDGQFSGGPFTDNHGPLRRGRYEASVLMPHAAVQSEDVQRVIGAEGEYLCGDGVRQESLGALFETAEWFEVTTGPSTVEKPTEDSAEAASLGMDVTGFISAWNRAVRGSGTYTSLLLPEGLQPRPGEVQAVLQYDFGGIAAMTAPVGKDDGMVRGVIILGQPGNEQELRYLYQSWTNLIYTTNANFTGAERQSVFEELGIGASDTDYSDHNAETVRGDIRYSVTFSDLMGFIFSAEPSDETT